MLLQTALDQERDKARQEQQKRENEKRLDDEKAEQDKIAKADAQEKQEKLTALVKDLEKQNTELKNEVRASVLASCVIGRLRAQPRLRSVAR